jgi:hypothetical protein
MKRDEARDLVVMLAAATSSRLNADETAVWEEQFLPLDAELATKAVLAGRREWWKFPPWSKFYEAYRVQKKLSESHAEQRSTIPEGKRGVTAPEWVHVWYWVRHKRDPRVPPTEAFPQMDGFCQPPQQMFSMKRYEELLGEWIDAGKPTAKISEIALFG